MDIVAAIPDPIYIKDGEGRFLYANRAALELLNRTMQEVVGRISDDFVFSTGEKDLEIQSPNLKGTVRVVERLMDSHGQSHKVRGRKEEFTTESGKKIGV